MDDIPDEADHMILRNPLVHGRGKEKQLSSVTTNEITGHKNPPNVN
jgi:hypothetical protein